jgi:hypothetical protein
MPIGLNSPIQLMRLALRLRLNFRREAIRQDTAGESSRTLGLAPAQRRGPSSRTDNGGHMRARRTPGEPFGCATKRLRPCCFGPFRWHWSCTLGISFDRFPEGER